MIVALDLPSRDEALSLCDRLEGACDFFKVGLELFISEGPRIIKDLKERDLKVFLDLKLHDIPNQVANSCRRIVGLGIDMFTLHTQGGREMMSLAVEAALSEAEKLGLAPPKILGVTVLTSLSELDLIELGRTNSLQEEVVTLARLAKESGLSGLVASPFEICKIKEVVDDEMLIVTPGIRLSGDEKDDQKRSMGPKEAVANGATHLVVGRPIIKANDPLEKAKEILKIMEGAKA